jgi:hypothetical protein
VQKQNISVYHPILDGSAELFSMLQHTEKSLQEAAKQS